MGRRLTADRNNRNDSDTAPQQQDQYEYDSDHSQRSGRWRRRHNRRSGDTRSDDQDYNYENSYTQRRRGDFSYDDPGIGTRRNRGQELDEGGGGVRLDIILGVVGCAFLLLFIFCICCPVWRGCSKRRSRRQVAADAAAEGQPLHRARGVEVFGQPQPVRRALTERESAKLAVQEALRMLPCITVSSGMVAHRGRAGGGVAGDNRALLESGALTSESEGDASADLQLPGVKSGELPQSYVVAADVAKLCTPSAPGDTEPTVEPGTRAITVADVSRRMEAADKLDQGRWVDEPCTVCLEEWQEGANVVVLPCLHRFHHHCAYRWACKQKQRVKQCPQCKQPMFLEHVRIPVGVDAVQQSG